MLVYDDHGQVIAEEELQDRDDDVAPIRQELVQKTRRRDS